MLNLQMKVLIGSVKNKTYILPTLYSQYAIVELVIPNRYVAVESIRYPIRHGHQCGSRVYLGQIHGKIDMNPKFIWMGKDGF